MVTVIKPAVQIVYYTIKHQWTVNTKPDQWVLSNWDNVASPASRIDREEVYQVYCKTGKNGYFDLAKAISGLALVRKESADWNIRFKLVKITWTPEIEQDITEQ